jgi:hypothetical protein
MTSATGDYRTLNKWRNRPGRDLLIALVILYVAAAIYTFTQSGDVSGSLMAPFLVGLTLPMGFAQALMIPTWTTLVALAIPLALILIIAIRMPGYVRVPLLLLLAAVSFYVTWAMGIVIS